MVASEMQMGHHCYPRPRNNAVHGRKAVVLCLETLQETQQLGCRRADRLANNYRDAVLEFIGDTG